ncbi:MAG TPA: SWIM zinc finger domain-containing protein, partial [Phycisphaerae bacterium]|nr:SWIM zinc finger domain-containing protein [Phycisphaerae bacterium]
MPGTTVKELEETARRATRAEPNMDADTRTEQPLTLKDRLSRLTFLQACRLLGEQGARLIREGGRYEIAIEEQVYLGDDLFRLKLDGAVVTITLMAEAPGRLRWNCTRCGRACEHVGAAFSLILEEKMALGLAAPPPERVPVESLSEEELIRRAIEEREERAREERMSIKSGDPRTPWTDYLVTNAVSGKTYRVALRGFERGQSYCSCPDYRKNTLGTCKHLLAVQRRVKARFPADVRSRPYVQRDLAVYLRYGTSLELRLLVPRRLDGAARAVVRPLEDRVINDVHDLLRRIRKLEMLGQAVIVYPDAEEHIQRCLLRDRLAATT